MKLPRSLAALAVVTTSFAADPTAPIDVHIGDAFGASRVVWGADAKLTAKPWAESLQARAVAERVFGEGGFEVFRLPIYAMRSADDPLYAQIAELARTARAINPDVVLFASVANGDGDQNNWLHGKHKFPADLLDGEGVYGLRLDRYAATLDAYLAMMRTSGVPASWLGVFNEDPAKPADYRALQSAMREDQNLTIVGVETWALRAGISSAPNLAPLVDLVGSHFYDDTQSKNPLPRADWTDSWRALVKAAAGKPVWFTEATDYRDFERDRIDDLLDGLDRLLPALNAGIDGVVMYQVVPRLVNFDNSIARKKWSGFQSLIQSTRHGQRRTTVHSGPVTLQTLAVANEIGSTLDLHIVNSGNSDLTLRLAFPSRKAAFLKGEARVWDASVDGETIPVSSASPADITVRARSYTLARVTPEPSP
jgi:hypothetical protein